MDQPKFNNMHAALRNTYNNAYLYTGDGEKKGDGRDVALMDNYNKPGIHGEWIIEPIPDEQDEPVNRYALKNTFNNAYLGVGNESQVALWNKYNDTNFHGEWIIEPIPDEQNEPVNRYALKNTYNNAYLYTEHGSYLALMHNYKQPGVHREWILEPFVDWDIQVTNIKYDNEKRKLETKPVVLLTSTIDNQSNRATVDQSISKTARKKSSFQFSFEQTLTIGYSFKFKTEVPEVASVEQTLSVEAAFKAGQIWTKEREDEYVFQQDIHVPENSSVRYDLMLDWTDDAVIPYTMTCIVKGKDKNLGKDFSGVELKEKLLAGGFDGTIVSTKDDFVTVDMKGRLTGAWGLNATVRTYDVVGFESHNATGDTSLSERRAVVIADSLHIRKDHVVENNQNILGYLKKGEDVTVIEEWETGDNIWVKLKPNGAHPQPVQWSAMKIGNKRYIEFTDNFDSAVG